MDSIWAHSRGRMNPNSPRHLQSWGSGSSSYTNIGLLDKAFSTKIHIYSIDNTRESRTWDLYLQLLSYEIQNKSKTLNLPETGMYRNITHKQKSHLLVPKLTSWGRTALAVGKEAHKLPELKSLIHPGKQWTTAAWHYNLTVCKGSFNHKSFQMKTRTPPLLWASRSLPKRLEYFY